MIGPHPDAERSQLRSLVAKIDRDISALPRQVSADIAATATDNLLASWANLVALLGLGPEPEVRECPVCKHTGMRVATRCGYCWSELSKLAPA
jgi:hypothetical protein